MMTNELNACVYEDPEPLLDPSSDQYFPYKGGCDLITFTGSILEGYEGDEELLYWKFGLWDYAADDWCDSSAPSGQGIDEQCTYQPRLDLREPGIYALFFCVTTDSGPDPDWISDFLNVWVCQVTDIEDGYGNYGDLFLPLGTTTQYLYAWSYPYGYQTVYFPTGYPIWSFGQVPAGANPALTPFADWCVGGGDDGVLVTGLTVPGVYNVRANCGEYDEGDDINVIVFEAILDIYNEHGGPKLAEADEASPGSFVLVNIDNDDGVNGTDNSNSVIDGESDKQDMAKMIIDFQPYTAPDLTIQLKASDASKVRVFNEGGTPVSFPETIAISRFNSGGLEYYVEGLSEGSCEFTFEVKHDGNLIINPAPKVKVTVKDYHNAFNKWGAWPGGQGTTSLNPTETINSSDLGLSGNVKWAVNHGGTSANIISHTPSTGDKWSQVVVRYDTQSSDNTFTEAVEIKAYDTGADSKIAGVRRTVFTCTWSPPNTTTDLDMPDNTLRFPGTSGTDDDKAEFNWDGENNATRTSAKMEGILNFTPTDIDWDARGVNRVYSNNGGSGKWKFRLQRQRIATIIGQPVGTGTRNIYYNDPDWVYDGQSDSGDAKYQSTTKPNKAFRIDAPSFDAADSLQTGLRADFRELAEWDNGNGWSIITSTTNAEWHENETSVLPNGAKGGANNHGAGATAADVPNTKPVANAGSNQYVGGGVLVTLDGSGSSDADNDSLTYQWTQTGGIPVTLSSNTVMCPTFTTPLGPATYHVFQLKVSDICKDLHHHNPGNYESDPDTVYIFADDP